MTSYEDDTERELGEGISTGTILSALCEHTSYEVAADVATEYGEPGYQNSYTAEVVLGNYWCRCGRVTEQYREGRWTAPYDDGSYGPFQTRAALHEYAHHYPRVFAALESRGVELVWSDEWMVDYDTGKAWRTTADSYSWEPSVIYDENGEYLTPDNDPSDWIAWCEDDPTSRCLMRWFPESALLAAGYVEHECGYESGWHPGQNANPVEIHAALIAEDPDAAVIFKLSETSQFYIGFCVFVRAGVREDYEDDTDTEGI